MFKQMKVMCIKIITLFIVGAVFTAGLMMGFGGSVFAGDPVPGLEINIEQIPGGRVSDTNYDSLLPNKTIGQVRMEVGNVLLGYGIGGADINKVTEALEGGGIYKSELKYFLLAIGMNEQDTQNILLEFDKLGLSQEGAQGVSTPGAGGAVPRATGSETKREEREREGLPSKQAKPAPATTPNAGDAARALVNQELHRPPTSLSSFFDVFTELSVKSIQNLKAAESKEEREDIRKELQANRETLQGSIQTLRQDLRANAKDLRENFRENVRTTIGHVDHGKTARIAVAHGKGLRMINRYRSAIARFDHILGRMESRVQKLEAQGADVSSVTALIEEAKNISVENEAKLEELKAKYESLLEGGNIQGVAQQSVFISGPNYDLKKIGEEARAIAKELKVEIEKLHGQLRAIADEIKHAYKNYKSSLSNTK